MLLLIVVQMMSDLKSGLTIRLVNVADVPNGMDPIIRYEHRGISQGCLPCAIDQRTVANQNVRHVDTSIGLYS